MKRNYVWFASIFFLILLFFSSFNFAVSDSLIMSTSEFVDVHFFWQNGCRHCKDEKVFLDALEEKYSFVRIHDYEISQSRENFELMISMAMERESEYSVVPLLFVGSESFLGWADESSTGYMVEKAVLSEYDLLNSVYDSNSSDSNSSISPDSNSSNLVALPFFGLMELKDVSLPVFTIVIAFFDGFNPCAMWVLIFLISMLLGLESRKKMWLYGSVFIAASAFVYFLFLAAWLNVFLFIGFAFWVRIIIGLVALFVAYHNIKEFFTNPSEGCKVAGKGKRKIVFEKITALVKESSVPLALLGLIFLAFAVNLVELVCSAGLPAVYTNILSMSSLTTFEYYSYLLLYIFIFMIDDLFIFFIAMTTLKLTGISTKYTRISHIVGGVLMLLIGLILIFAPELLMFG